MLKEEVKAWGNEPLPALTFPPRIQPTLLKVKLLGHGPVTGILNVRICVYACVLVIENPDLRPRIQVHFPSDIYHLIHIARFLLYNLSD